jgi:hypothetical protein
MRRRRAVALLAEAKVKAAWQPHRLRDGGDRAAGWDGGGGGHATGRDGGGSSCASGRGERISDRAAGRDGEAVAVEPLVET